MVQELMQGSVLPVPDVPTLSHCWYTSRVLVRGHLLSQCWLPLNFQIGEHADCIYRPFKVLESIRFCQSQSFKLNSLCSKWKEVVDKRFLSNVSLSFISSAKLDYFITVLFFSKLSYFLLGSATCHSSTQIPHYTCIFMDHYRLMTRLLLLNELCTATLFHWLRLWCIFSWDNIMHEISVANGHKLFCSMASMQCLT